MIYCFLLYDLGMWQGLIEQALDTNIYNAKLAGFSYSFSIGASYVKLEVHGYVDEAPLHLFLSTVLKGISLCYQHDVDQAEL